MLKHGAFFTPPLTFIALSSLEPRPVFPKENYKQISTELISHYSRDVGTSGSIDIKSIKRGFFRNRLLLLLMFTRLTSPLSAQQSEIDSNKKAAIEEQMRVTGALKISEQFRQAMNEQMTLILQQSRPDIQQQAFVSVGEEVQLVMSEKMASGAIENLFFPFMTNIFHLKKFKNSSTFIKPK